MKRTQLFAGAALALLIAAGSQAQTAQDVKEKVQDRRIIRQDVANVQIERADVDRLSDLVMRWDGLRAADADPQKIAKLQTAIAAELRHDLKLTAVQTAEAARKTAQAKQELRHDRRDVRSDVAEVQADKAVGDQADVVQDRQELRDDLKDKRDDRRDAVKEKVDLSRADQILESKRDLVVQLCDLQNQIDRGRQVERLQNRQGELLNQYVKLSREEVRLGVRQFVQDKQELREDRQKARQDAQVGDDK